MLMEGVCVLYKKQLEIENPNTHNTLLATHTCLATHFPAIANSPKKQSRAITDDTALLSVFSRILDVFSATSRKHLERQLANTLQRVQYP
jgi:hypothetical protein